MTTGTIIGEMSNPMNKPLNGISERESPSAARVPRLVAKSVDAIAMMNEFWIDRRQISLDQKSSYHRVEKAAGSKAIISEVKVKYGSELKLSGIITRIGAIKNKKTNAQMPMKE